MWRVTSIMMWVIGLLWMAPMMLLMAALSLVISPDKTEWLSRIYTRGQLLLTFSRWRAHVDPKVDPTRQYIFLQNHINNLDHVTVYNATPHFKQGIELQAHFRYPIYGGFMRRRGTIPVHKPPRKDEVERLKAAVAREVAKGHSILAFPEGTRTRNGRIGTLRKGMFVIARDLGLPIVPVTVTGMYEVMRKGSLQFSPFKRVTVHVDAPIETAGVSDDALAAIIERVRATMTGHVDAYYAESWARSSAGSEVGASHRPKLQT